MNPGEWRVMVVEDEDDSAHLLSQLLSHYGVQVKVVRNGLECLAHVESFWPTLIIMDLAMPELDGWQTLKHLRLNPNVASIPVIAVTAFDTPQVADDAATSGFDAYFAKPIDIDNFIDHLTQIITTCHEN
jgi:CheY-like chemotaxis protein